MMKSKEAEDLNVISRVACCPRCGHPLWARISVKKNLVLICPKDNVHVSVERARLREFAGHKKFG